MKWLEALLLAALTIVIMWCLAAMVILLRNDIGSCSASYERKNQVSTHEKQEEARLANTRKIPEDERFIF